MKIASFFQLPGMKKKINPAGDYINVFLLPQGLCPADIKDNVLDLEC
jgi:hypothetical protein